MHKFNFVRIFSRPAQSGPLHLLSTFSAVFHFFYFASLIIYFTFPSTYTPDKESHSKKWLWMKSLLFFNDWEEISCRGLRVKHEGNNKAAIYTKSRMENFIYFPVQIEKIT